MSPDIKDLFPIKVVPSTVKANGQVPSYWFLYRAIKTGKNGVKLKYALFGRSIMTCNEWIREYMLAVGDNGTTSTPEEPVQYRPSKKKKRPATAGDLDGVKQRLRDMGV